MDRHSNSFSAYPDIYIRKSEGIPFQQILFFVVPAQVYINAGAFGVCDFYGPGIIHFCLYSENY